MEGRNRPSDVQDTREHRPRESRSVRIADTHPSLTPRAPPNESKGKQRCYYGFFVILFIATLLTNFVSFVLFLIIDIEVKGDGTFFETCILFAGGDGESLTSGAWSCDVVLAVKAVVIIVTVLVFIVYLILTVKGTKVFSACRILDMLVFLALSLLSCATGIILRLGLEQTLSKCSPGTCDWQEKAPYFQGFIKASEYTSYGLSAVYLFCFFCELILVIGYCIAQGRRRSSQSEENLALLGKTHRVYTSMKADNSLDTPFRDDNHL